MRFARIEQRYDGAGCKRNHASSFLHRTKTIETRDQNLVLVLRQPTPNSWCGHGARLRTRLCPFFLLSAWCRGITSASRAETVGFKPHLSRQPRSEWEGAQRCRKKRHRFGLRFDTLAIQQIRHHGKPFARARGGIDLCEMQAVGFEPTRSYLQWILSPPP